MKTTTRRDFIATTGALAGAMIVDPLTSFGSSPAFPADKKKRVAIVGTGSRAHGMWSKSVLEAYSDKV